MELSHKFVIPEFPYPLKQNKLMDIYVADDNVIEIKYLRSGGVGGLTQERGRFYADLCKLALYSPNYWDTFLFLILDEVMLKHFKSNISRREFEKPFPLIRGDVKVTLDLLSLKPVQLFVDWLHIKRSDFETQLTIYKKLREEIGEPNFKEISMKVELCFDFKISSSGSLPNFNFYLLRLTKKHVLF